MTESKFPLCERLGLTVWHKGSVEAGNGQGFYAEVIEARKLESILASATVVYGIYTGSVFQVPYPRLGMQSGTSDPDTHTARLLMIEEIPKAVTKAELNEALAGYTPGALRHTLERILQHGYRG